MTMYRNIKEQLRKEKNNYSLLVLLCIYAFTCGQQLNVGVAAELSTWEFILLNITNHYYLIYGLFLYFIYWTFGNIRTRSNVEKIRYQSIKRYYKMQMTSAFVKICLVVLCHVIIAALIGMTRLSVRNGFTGHLLAAKYHDTLEYLLHFKDYFRTPMEALAAVGIYLVLGLFVICNVMFYAYEWKGKMATVLAMVLVLVSVMIGFRTQMNESLLGFLCLNNYFVLHHVLFVGKTFYGVLKVLGYVAVMCIVPILLRNTCIRARHSGRRTMSCEMLGKVTCNPQVVVAFVVVLLGIQLVPTMLQHENVMDFLFLITKGYSNMGFHLIEFLYYIMFFVFPIFVIDIFLENEKKGKNQLAQFRCQSRRKWEQMIRISNLTFLMKYVMMYSVVGVVLLGVIYFTSRSVVSTINEDIASAYGLETETIMVLVVVSFFLRMVELLFLFLWNQLLVKYMPSTTIAFLLTFSGYAINLLLGSVGVINQSWIFGNASLYQLMENYSQNGLLNMAIHTMVAFAVGFLAIKIVPVYLERRENLSQKKWRNEYGNGD